MDLKISLAPRDPAREALRHAQEAVAHSRRAVRWCNVAVAVAAANFVFQIAWIVLK